MSGQHDSDQCCQLCQHLNIPKHKIAGPAQYCTCKIEMNGMIWDDLKIQIQIHSVSI